MRNFSEMAFVKVLLVALVVVFVGGLIGADGALASADLRAFGGGGVEGDPTDGTEGDYSGGGSTSSPITEDYPSDDILEGIWGGEFIFYLVLDRNSGLYLSFLPKIIHGQFVFVLPAESIGRAK